MADAVNEITLDGSIDSAQQAIEALLNAEPSGQDINGNPVTPDPDPNPSQAAPNGADPADASATSTEAPADVTTAPAVQPSTVKAPASSPELETRLAEAAKKEQQAETARNQYVNALNVHIPQLQAAVRGKYPDIQTEDDLISLSDPNSPKYDPARYNAFQADAARVGKAIRDRDSAAQEQQKADGERLTAWRQEQQTKVAELIPELKDPAKGPALAQKIWAAAQKEGYTREQMERASATDVHLLYRSMLYQDGEAAKVAQAAEAAKALEAAKDKAAKAPPVQTPGTRNANAKDERVQTDFERLQKSGRTDDAAAMFRHILN